MVREPQGSRHAAAIRGVLAALHRALGDAWQIDSQLPIALDDASEPEPDVAVVPRIAEYWIVDLVPEALEVHREPQASPAARYGWLYRSVETLRPPAAVAPLVALDRAIPVADLLP